MKFEPVTEFYAECAQTRYRIVKYGGRGVPDYSAWHPQCGFIQHGFSSAKEAARACRDHAEAQKNNNGGGNGEQS